jgi:hypothetical protein
MQTPRTGPPFLPSRAAPEQPLAGPVSGEHTQLSTVNTSHGFSQPPQPSRVSRMSLAVALMGAIALLVALGIGFVVTRPAANAGTTNSGVKTADAPPAPSVTSAPPPPVESTPPVASTAPAASVSAKPVGKPIFRGKTGGTKPVGCDPPFEFDKEGKKHFKPECL